MNEKIQINNLTLFVIGFVFCIVGIALLTAALINTPCNEGCQELACQMNESQCPPQDELGVTSAAVYSPDGSLRSVTFLDCHTGEYRTYTTNMSEPEKV